MEAVHGIVKQKWKSLSVNIKNTTLPKVKSYFRIAGCLHNLHSPRLLSDSDNIEYIASTIMEKVDGENCMEKYLTEKNVFKKGIRYTPLTEENSSSFPMLCLNDLKMITLGTYQVTKAISYVAEHLERRNNLVMVYNVKKSLITLKIQSRHKFSTEYKIWVKYTPNGNGKNSIKGLVCSCPSGLRTVGCCIHITSALLYLGNLTRYDSREFYPAKILNSLFKDGQTTLNDDTDEE